MLWGETGARLAEEEGCAEVWETKARSERGEREESSIYMSSSDSSS